MNRFCLAWDLLIFILSVLVVLDAVQKKKKDVVNCHSWGNVSIFWVLFFKGVAIRILNNINLEMESMIILLHNKIVQDGYSGSFNSD